MADSFVPGTVVLARSAPREPLWPAVICHPLGVPEAVRTEAEPRKGVVMFFGPSSQPGCEREFAWTAKSEVHPADKGSLQGKRPPSNKHATSFQKAVEEAVEVLDKGAAEACPNIFPSEAVGAMAPRRRSCPCCGSSTESIGALCSGCERLKDAGQCCPLCEHPWHFGAEFRGVECDRCGKWVHDACDREAQRAMEATSPEPNDEVQYVCKLCQKKQRRGPTWADRADANKDEAPEREAEVPEKMEMEHFRDELWDDEEAWNDVKTSAANDDEWEFSQARSAWDIFSDRFQRLFSQHFPKRDVPAREVSKMALKEWRFASSQARASFEHLAQQEQSHFVSRLEWHETGHALRRSSRRPQRRGAEALSSRDGGDLTTAGVSHSSQQFSRGRYNSAADLEGPADENEVDPNERQVDRVGIVCNSRQGDYMVSHDQVECECDECDGRVMSASEFVVHAGLANVDDAKEAMFIEGTDSSLGQWLEESRSVAFGQQPGQATRAGASDRGGERRKKKNSVRLQWQVDHCAVCDVDLDEPENQLLTCSSCGVVVHQYCYGVPQAGTDEAWTCRACEYWQDTGVFPECAVCPVEGGALKPMVEEGCWCHLACYQWLPGLKLCDLDALEPVYGLSSIDKDRWDLLCTVCRQRNGAKRQCDAEGCCIAYHPLCARAAGLDMRIIDDGPDWPLRHISSCHVHGSIDRKRAIRFGGHLGPIAKEKEGGAKKGSQKKAAASKRKAASATSESNDDGSDDDSQERAPSQSQASADHRKKSSRAAYGGKWKLATNEHGLLGCARLRPHQATGHPPTVLATPDAKNKSRREMRVDQGKEEEATSAIKPEEKDEHDPHGVEGRDEEGVQELQMEGADALVRLSQEHDGCGQEEAKQTSEGEAAQNGNEQARRRLLFGDGAPEQEEAPSSTLLVPIESAGVAGMFFAQTGRVECLCQQCRKEQGTTMLLPRQFGAHAAMKGLRKKVKAGGIRLRDAVHGCSAGTDLREFLRQAGLSQFEYTADLPEKSIAASDGGQETEGESQGREQQATHLASVSISRNVALALGQCLVGRKVRIPRLADATGIITGCNFSRSGALEHVIRFSEGGEATRVPLSDEEGLEWADVLQKPRLEFFPPSSLQKPPQAMKDAAIVVCNGNLGRLHSRESEVECHCRECNGERPRMTASKWKEHCGDESKDWRDALRVVLIEGGTTSARDWLASRKVANAEDGGKQKRQNVRQAKPKSVPALPYIVAPLIVGEWGDTWGRSYGPEEWRKMRGSNGKEGDREERGLKETSRGKLDRIRAEEFDLVTFGKSGIHGWGLFAKRAIPAGKAVTEFRGEVVSPEEADRREGQYEEEGKDCYMLKADKEAVIDATEAGCLGRFINHCCDPNLFTRSVRFPNEPCSRIVFFSRCAIPVGAELTFDYRFESEEGSVPCFCGALSCRGYLC